MDSSPAIGLIRRSFEGLLTRNCDTIETVVFRAAEISKAARLTKGGFRVTVKGSRKSVTCRKLLIATGVFDHLPPIEGIKQYFGRSAFQCPYCDGWECAARRLLFTARARGDSKWPGQ